MVKGDCNFGSFLQLVVDFCIYWIIVLNGVAGVLLGRVALQLLDHPIIVTVHMDRSFDWEDHWVQLDVVVEEAEGGVYTIYLC